MTQDQSGMFGAAGTGDTSGYGGLVRQAVSFGSTERPYGSYFDEVADDLERAYPDFSDAITRVVVDRGELTLHIKKERLVEVASILRDKLKFEMCMGVSGVHYPERTGAELVALYPLLSMTKNQRVRLEVATSELESTYSISR
jgi:NADH-quinone oxidoreductase subunit C